MRFEVYDDIWFISFYFIIILFIYLFIYLGGVSYTATVA